MIKKQSVFFLLSLVYFSPLKAQYTDSVPPPEKPLLSLKNNTKLESKRFPYRQFFLPSFAIAYGVTTLRSNRLKEVNLKIKEEVWMEKPHKTVHIDDYLKFAPAVAVYGLNMAGIKGKHNLVDRSIMYVMSNAFANVTVFSLKGITKTGKA